MTRVNTKNSRMENTVDCIAYLLECRRLMTMITVAINIMTIKKRVAKFNHNTFYQNYQTYNYCRTGISSPKVNNSLSIVI